MQSFQSARDELDRVAKAALNGSTTPGCAVGVLHQGDTITRGYGIANIETGLPVTPDTLFQLASISKVFTASMVMRLVDEGVLELDAPVTTYLPDLVLSDPEAQATITLRHLLAHSSGLHGDYFGEFGPGDDALERAVAQFRTVPQHTRPGELWAYANSGYVLAGAVIARVLGTTFETAMRERLLSPLGLTRSFYFAHEAIAYPVAVGHNPSATDPSQLVVARRYAIPRVSAPSGGLISTVGDLLHLARLLLADGSSAGPALLQPALIEEMRCPQTPAANFADAWGLGLDIRGIDGVHVIGHGGGSNGFSTRLTLVPSQAFALAILTNGYGDAELDIHRWALAHYCGLQPRPSSLIELTPTQLARFAGRYRSPQDRLSVTVADGGLRVEMRVRRLMSYDGQEFSPPPLLLRPISEREFVVDGEQTEQRVDFILTADGQPRFIRYGGRIANRLVGDDAEHGSA